MIPANRHLLTCCCIALLLVFAACKKNGSSLSLPPANLVYTPDTAIVLKGVSDTSITPIINWNGRKGSFSFMTSPIQGISIDNGTGKISWASSLPIGTYLLPVIAGNSVATDTIIYTLIVSGRISTVAGGIRGFFGDGGSAVNALLNNPSDVTVDAQGNIYIADTYNSRIRVINTDGSIHTVAGDGQFAFAGDGGPAILAELSGPFAISTDSLGNLYMADYGNNSVRKIDTHGIISTVAGGSDTVALGDGGPATQARLYLIGGKVAVDGQGSVYIADYGDMRVRKVTPDGIIHTVAGNGKGGTSISDGTLGVNASISAPCGVYYNGGNVYIADYGAMEVCRLNSGNLYNVAGQYFAIGNTGDGGPALKARLNRPTNIVGDGQGNFFIADFANNKIREIDSKGNISTVAGNGQQGFSGDNGPAAAAELAGPFGLAIDTNGDLYIADAFNNRIRKVTLH